MDRIALRRQNLIPACAMPYRTALGVTYDCGEFERCMEAGLRLAANPEFKQRAYGIPGLAKVYGITGISFTPISDGGGPATVKALVSGKVDVADIYSTTPSIAANKLVTLEDPKNLIAAQNVVPLIREEKATAEVTDVLDAVSAALTTDELLELNEANQGEDKEAPAALAKEWVAEHVK